MVTTFASHLNEDHAATSVTHTLLNYYAAGYVVSLG